MYMFSFTRLNTNYTLAYGEFQGHIDHEADRVNSYMDASISVQLHLNPNDFRKLIKCPTTQREKHRVDFFSFFPFSPPYKSGLYVKIKSIHKVPSEGFKKM